MSPGVFVVSPGVFGLDGSGLLGLTGCTGSLEHPKRIRPVANKMKSLFFIVKVVWVINHNGELQTIYRLYIPDSRDGVTFLIYEKTGFL